MPHKVRTYDTELIRKKPDNNYVLSSETSLDAITHELGSIPIKISCETDESKSTTDKIYKRITEEHGEKIGTKIWQITLEKPEETVTSEDEWNVTKITLLDDSGAETSATMTVEGFSMLI
jgi:hypothetical protein